VSNLSKLLQKIKGEVPDAVRPLIAEETPGPGSESDSRPGQPGPSAPEPPSRPAPAEALDLSRIRTLNLHIPAPSPLLPFENSHWRPSEQYRILRTRISRHSAQPHSVVITSPDSGDGKSVTAINTAAALALKSEGAVLLLDADLRRPAIHAQLGLPERPGLADVLTGACTAEEALVHTQEFPNLFVLCAGASRGNPAELLDSKQWRALVTRFRSMFRYVIVDSPPVGGLADYELIQAVCDAVVLVFRPDFTNRDLCMNALESMPKSKFLGVVLNCIPEWSPGKHTGSDYYYYSRNKVYVPGQPGRAADAVSSLPTGQE
jgi:capsular exopolysaccharide synthesis family protein